MEVYTYKARDLNGLLVNGELEAETANAIREMLGEQGLIPISVTAGKKTLGGGFNLKNLFNSVKGEELMLFTRQFHTLFKAGMDMETMLGTLSSQMTNEYFSKAIKRIQNDVAAGSSLARAFAQHPKIFNDLYTNMLATGEEAGILDEVLSQLSGLMEKEITLKSAVKSATLYPKIVMGALVVATIVVMTVILPKFQGFYASFGAKLPLPTRILMGTSDFFLGYWYIIALIVGGTKFAYSRWVSTQRGRYLMDIFIWKLPVFGSLGQKVANARFANILGALYKAGLPVTRALEITAKTMGHAAFEKDIMGVKLEVEKGRGIAEAMRDVKYFNSLIVEATAIGEKSGALDDMYKAIGTHYDMEVSHTLKNLTTMIEPILLGFVFGLISIFALAIFMPMLNVNRAVMHKD